MTDLPAHLPIAIRFEAFHAANPHVYEVLCDLSRQWLASGKTRLGVKALFEGARWELGLRTVTADGEYKLSNDYTAYYARLLIHNEEDLAGLFDLRASEADEWVWLRTGHDRTGQFTEGAA